MEDFVLKDFLPYQLSLLAGQLSKEFATYYREQFGISVSEWRILAHLSQTADPLSVREIFGQVGMEKPKISRAASRLHKKGYVTKTQNQKDRRLVALSLSKKGQNLLHEMTPVAERFEREVMDRIGVHGDNFRAAVKLLCWPQGH